MIPILWKNCAANFTSDLRIAISQGSCFGGSTVINDAVCFPLSGIVKRRWRDMGVSISDDEWDAATSEVSAEIRVTEVRENELSNNSLMLRRGCGQWVSPSITITPGTAPIVCSVAFATWDAIMKQSRI